MAWQLRHEGSPKVVKDLTFTRIVEGLRDGQWNVTDEVLAPGDKAWRAIENHPQFAELMEDWEAVPPRRHEEPTSLDLNAMIDVCLVLLIFFILTTTYQNLVQKVVPLPLAKGDGTNAKRVRIDDVKNKMIRVQAQLDKAGNPVVRVDNQNVNVLADDGKGIDVDRLASVLRPLVRGDDRKTEILLDAKEITWEHVIQIQDGARSAGIQTVHHLLRK
jgi:biopolymer transport protein ExbD